MYGIFKILGIMHSAMLNSGCKLLAVRCGTHIDLLEFFSFSLHYKGFRCTQLPLIILAITLINATHPFGSYPLQVQNSLEDAKTGLTDEKRIFYFVIKLQTDLRLIIAVL